MWKNRNLVICHVVAQGYSITTLSALPYHNWLFSICPLGYVFCVIRMLHLFGHSILNQAPSFCLPLNCYSNLWPPGCFTEYCLPLNCCTVIRGLLVVFHYMYLRTSYVGSIGLFGDDLFWKLSVHDFYCLDVSWLDSIAVICSHLELDVWVHSLRLPVVVALGKVFCLCNSIIYICYVQVW